MCRQAGILTEGEQTIDEACKALLLALAKAGSPRPGTKAFSRWLRKPPEFAERCRLLEVLPGNGGPRPRRRWPKGRLGTVGDGLLWYWNLWVGLEVAVAIRTLPG